MAEMQRRGDVEKCPACGWRLDPGAYRCPKCRIYFCYKCRARVGEREEQFQCADQSCHCYGKLLCTACVVPIPKSWTEPRDVEEPDASLAATFCGAVAGGVAFYVALFVAPNGGDHDVNKAFNRAFFVALGIGVGAAVAARFGLRALGFNVWGSTDKKHTETISHSTTHTCCVQCKHPVKRLR